jgi:hypothetical protein
LAISAFLQRFGSDLKLTPHFHALVFDGVYAAEPGEHPRFYPLRPPEKRDVTAVAERVARVTVLTESKAGIEAGEDELPPMAALYSASIAGRIGSGSNAGQSPSMLGKFNAEAVGEDEPFGGIRCARVSGFSVHAGVGIRAADRKGLERLCRYGSRPPVAADRLARLPDGRLSYRLKTPWSNGATHVLFEPLELVERLAVLVPAAAPESDPLSRCAGACGEVASLYCAGASLQAGRRCRVQLRKGCQTRFGTAAQLFLGNPDGQSFRNRRSRVSPMQRTSPNLGRHSSSRKHPQDS